MSPTDLKKYCFRSAFPCQEDENNFKEDGLTRQEFIATFLLQGMLSNPMITHPSDKSSEVPLSERTALLAVDAAELAKILVAHIW